MSSTAATEKRLEVFDRVRWALVARPVALKFALVAVLVLWPLAYSSLYGLSVMTTAGLYVLVVVSVHVILGEAGQLSFGHATFYGIGAYSVGVLAVKYGVPTLLCLVAGALIASLAALVVGRPVLRLKYFYLALATIGLGQIFAVVVSQTPSLTGGAMGLAPIPDLRILGYAFEGYESRYYLVWVFALLVLLFTEKVLKSRVGRSFRAVATSETAAATLGVRTANWKLLAFVLSAAYAGLAGGLFAFVTGAISPASFSFNAALLPVIMMLVGGRSLWGGVLGAILMTWLLNGLSGAQQYSGLVYTIVLLLLLLFLPAGVSGGLRHEHRSWLRARLGLSRAAVSGVPSPGGPASEAGSPAAGSALVPATGAVVGPMRPPLSAIPQAATAVARKRNGSSVSPLLEIRGVSVDFGGLRAVNDVSLVVVEGSITAIIGPNGAGKTTLFNVITRLQRPTTGDIVFGGQSITGESAAAAARLGMARTFQNLRIFPNMTVLENVLVGCHRHERSGIFAAGLGLPSQRREERRSQERAQEALALMGLEEHAHLPAAALPYGRQRLVEIARALASQPRLLLLDEPAAGMNGAERSALVERIAAIREEGVTVLLVEHDIELVMGLSDAVVVLDHGSLIGQGAPEQVRADPAVIEAYLGVRRAEGHDRTPPRAVRPDAHRPDGSSAPSPLLVVGDVRTAYGPIEALHGVSLEVPEGQIVAVLGANGAGKSTLLYTISGALKPTAGRIEFAGQDVTGLSAPSVASLGIRQVPEGRRIFTSLNVEDNLLMGASGRPDRAGYEDDLAFIYDLFPILAERRSQPARTLSGGQQQMLAIGRALAGGPRLLLLDEPSLGLAPRLVEHIFESLVKLNDRGLTMLMVEQNAELALSVAHHAVVLQTGTVALAGPAAALRRDDRVRECYLGQVAERPLSVSR